MDASHRRLMRVVLATVSAGTLALVLAGCSPSPVTSPEPTLAATTIPVPDIGPSPAPSVIDAEQIEALRLAQQDLAWEQVLGQHPAATRPTVPFVSYVSEDEVLDALIECYTNAEITIDIGVDSQGNRGGIMTSDLTEAEAVAGFVCRQTNLSEPRAPINTAQLGWLYDYLTEFYVPCLEANGVENPPAPSREDFISNWPNQGWFPSVGSGFMDPGEDIAILAACPPPK